MVMVAQNFRMPSINSCFVRGFISLLRYSLSSCHKFSIGLRSGDSAGVFHQFMPLSSKKDAAIREVCLGSLSCMYLWPSGNLWHKKGSSVLSSMLTKRGAFILPSNMQHEVAPCQLMPPQICTLTGCLALKNTRCCELWCERLHPLPFVLVVVVVVVCVWGGGSQSTYLGLLLGGSPFFLQQNLLCDSSCTLVSSVQTMSSKKISILSLAHWRRLALFASLINWQ